MDARVTEATDDGLHAETTIGPASWSMPDHLPPRRDLEDAEWSLTDALLPCDPIIFGQQIERLRMLTGRQQDTIDTWAAVVAEYTAMLGGYPADLIVFAVDAWLKNPAGGQWFPKIGDMEGIIAPMVARRRRRLERVRAMLAAPPKPPPRKEESVVVRFRAVADSYAKHYGPDHPKAIKAAFDADAMEAKYGAR